MIAAFLPELRARQELVAAGRPTADRAEGLARAAAGGRADAIALLEASIRQFDVLDLYEGARTREALAALMDEPGDRAELLAAALETYERLGAVPDARRLGAAG